MSYSRNRYLRLSLAVGGRRPADGAAETAGRRQAKHRNIVWGFN